jgi:hypothetical protein
MQITKTHLRLINFPDSSISFLENNGMLPFDLDHIEKIKMATVQQAILILQTATWSDDGKLLSISQGPADAKIVTQFTYDAGVIVSKKAMAYGVIIKMVYDAEGRALKESVIGTDGVEVVRGEYLYTTINGKQCMTHIMEYPVKDTSKQIPVLDSDEVELSVTFALIPDSAPLTTTFEHDDLGRCIKERGLDGIVEYLYADPSKTQACRIVENISHNLKRYTDFSFDVNDNMTHCKRYMSEEQVLEEFSMEYIYDDAGRVVTAMLNTDGKSIIHIDFSEYLNR